MDEREREYRAKIASELAQADSLVPGADLIASSGEFFAEVLCVKGEPGPAEAAGGEALSGPDGEAVAKALCALGFDPSCVFATVARSEPDSDPGTVASRIRAQIEAVDPYVVIALDPVAAHAVSAALSLKDLRPGRVRRLAGREFLALDGLEASLTDQQRKKRVWRQMKALTPRGPSM
ncbi:MAG: hypothetical protein KGZ40_00680 [Clostridiales bacterium]|nr:hypothetical protein [Clostridiales bacterium]